jgi:hypothetical protein
MGMRFKKSINLGGGTRINISKSGIGGSVGTKGFRYTQKANGGTRTTASIPGTGLSYVKDSNKRSSGTPAAANELGWSRVGAFVMLICAIPIILLGLLLAIAAPALGLGFAAFGVVLLIIRKVLKNRINRLLEESEESAYEETTMDLQQSS